LATSQISYYLAGRRPFGGIFFRPAGAFEAAETARRVSSACISASVSTSFFGRLNSEGFIRLNVKITYLHRPKQLVFQDSECIDFRPQAKLGKQRGNYRTFGAGDGNERLKYDDANVRQLFSNSDDSKEKLIGEIPAAVRT